MEVFNSIGRPRRGLSLPLRLSARAVIVVLAAAALSLFPAVPNGMAQTLFTDTFEADSSALWVVREGSSDGRPDFTVQFFYDYGTNRYVAGGVTNLIPPAPNSTAGTTRGVKLTVNKDNIPATAAVSLYPAGLSFSNHYALRADMWINYNAPAFGSAFGSTEFGTVGLNHVGDKVTWNESTNSDGVWFAVCGEAAAGLATISDYNAYVGTNDSPAVRLQGVDGGFLDRDGNGAREFEVNVNQPATYPLKLMFPAPLFETPGAPGKHWVEVEVRQRLDDIFQSVVTWLINGYVIAEHTRAATFGQTAGNVMIGTMDPFSSIASPKADNFVIFDNVRVVDLDLETPNPVVGISSADTAASEPGTDTAEFTLARTGETTAPLTVHLRLSGTASNGVDYATVPTSVTFPAGVASTNFTITPLDDSIGEATERIVIVLAGSRDYDVREALFVAIDLADDVDTTPQPPGITGIRIDGGSVQIDFTGGASDAPEVFSLQSSAIVASGYANEPGAGVTQLGPGSFRATAPISGAIRFYRIRR
jgi:hypothetical protein